MIHVNFRTFRTFLRILDFLGKSSMSNYFIEKSLTFFFDILHYILNRDVHGTMYITVRTEMIHYPLDNIHALFE